MKAGRLMRCDAVLTAFAVVAPGSSAGERVAIERVATPRAKPRNDLGATFSKKHHFDTDTD